MEVTTPEDMGMEAATAAAMADMEVIQTMGMVEDTAIQVITITIIMDIITTPLIQTKSHRQ